MEAMVRPRDRVRFAVAHAVMRGLLVHYVGGNAVEVEIRQEAHGKPYIARGDGAGGELMFNLSHSEDRALLGVARDRRIGVDLERERDQVDVMSIARRFFAPGERDMLASLPESDRRAWFHRQWVGKEAVLKAHGMGLSAPPERFDVVFDEGGGGSVLCAGRAPGCEWTLRLLDAGPGWHAAVASAGRDWFVRLRSPGSPSVA
jgi:4'-phosphopantetheinyl transferase